MKEVSESWWLNKEEKRTACQYYCPHQMYLIELQYCFV